MKTSRLTIIAISVVAGLWWGVERSTGKRLQMQRDDLRQQADELARLQREHGRLLDRSPSADELARLRRAATARAGAAPLENQAMTAGPAPSRSALQPGAWAAVSEWKNRGRGTAESALETMLWAAAGGDLGVLRDTLEFDEESRAKAAVVFARLPDTARAAYSTPDELLALLIAGNVPLDSVQFVASQVRNENEVTEFVRLRDPKGATRQVYLTLHRDLVGWRLHVPTSAVEGIMPDLPKAAGP